MKVGINPDVCDKTGCEYKYDEMLCKLIECDDANFVGNYRCPIPKKCPYGSIHIVSNEPLLKCGECKYEKDMFV